MLVEGFKDCMHDLFMHPDMPAVGKRQTLMFSATFPDAVQQVAHEHLEKGFALLAVDEIGAANKCITQEVGENFELKFFNLWVLKKMNRVYLFFST
jgi:superfamily II DNA/RNA helicase